MIASGLLLQKYPPNRDDPEGKPKDVLVAERMTHYKNDDGRIWINRDDPLQKEGEQPWIFERNGTSLAEGKAVLLHAMC